MADDLPIILTIAGAQPQSPAALRAALVAGVEAVNPGVTLSLEGSLLEDVTSTDVGAIALIDQARVELINSLTPFGANAFLLNQLGQIYGVPLGQASNTSVYVVFTGPPGLVIAKGFTVSDGSFQYVLRNGGIIKSDGQSAPLYALATQSGSWVVPSGTVTQLVTAKPPGVTLTVVNPEAGLSGNGSETATSYRSRVLQAGLAASQGMSRYLKTLLGNVTGVQTRLVAAQMQVGGGWKIIVGGGDPYEVAYAIYTSLFDISTLVGSTLFIEDITADDPGLVTTFLNHGYDVGQDITITDVDPSDFDGDYAVYSVPSEKTFELGTNFAAQNLTGLSWGSGGGGTVTATTAVNHGIPVGSSFTIANCVPTEYNGTHVAISGTATTTLKWALTPDPGIQTTLGQLEAGIAKFDAGALSPYVSGGQVDPDLRNAEVSITDWPDTYIIPIVIPPLQTVTLALLWNTTSTNLVAPAAVAQLGAPALAAYINSITVGQPINLFQLQSVFKAAIASVLQPELVTRMVFTVAINGIGTPVDSGTGIFEGDPESYFFAEASGMSITQG